MAKKLKAGGWDYVLWTNSTINTKFEDKKLKEQFRHLKAKGAYINDLPSRENFDRFLINRQISAAYQRLMSSASMHQYHIRQVNIRFCGISCK